MQLPLCHMTHKTCPCMIKTKKKERNHHTPVLCDTLPNVPQGDWKEDASLRWAVTACWQPSVSTAWRSCSSTTHQPKPVSLTAPALTLPWRLPLGTRVHKGTRTLAEFALLFIEKQFWFVEREKNNNNWPSAGFDLTMNNVSVLGLSKDMRRRRNAGSNAVTPGHRKVNNPWVGAFCKHPQPRIPTANGRGGGGGTGTEQTWCH